MAPESAACGPSAGTGRAGEAGGLLSRLPPIVRARDFYLYDIHGRRYLDLWLDGGRALLGRRPDGLSTRLKNEIDRGGCAALPSVETRRFEKAILASFPGHAAVRLYADTGRACAALAAAGFGEPADPAIICDPAGRAVSGAAAASAVSALSAAGAGDAAACAFWRPFLPAPGTDLPASSGPGGLPGFAPEGAAAILPVLPFPLGPSPQAVLFRTAEAAASVAPSDVVAPFWLSGLTRTLALLAAAPAGYGEPLWSRFDRLAAGVWARRGPYLYPRCSPGEYPAFFTAALGAGVLVSPDWRMPSVVPGRFSAGDLRRLSPGG